MCNRIKNDTGFSENITPGKNAVFSNEAVLLKINAAKKFVKTRKKHPNPKI